VRSLNIAGLALQGLRRNPLRVTLTTLGVTIASAALVSMVALAVGLQRRVETPFKALGLLNNIQVRPKEGDGAADAPPLDDAALGRMEQLPGVAVAYPDIYVKNIKVRYGDKEETGIGAAMPRETALLGVVDEFLVAGRFFDQGTEPEVILGVQIVRGLGFKSPQEAIGVKVTLEATGLSPEEGKSFTFQRKQFTVTVVGVYEPPALLPALAQRGIGLPVELMKEVPGVHFESALSRLKAGGQDVAPSYGSATVRVQEPSAMAAVEKQVQEMGFRTRTVLSRMEEMRTFFLVFQLLMAMVGTVAMVIAALGIANTLLMAVLERYQEIGICKAIGASDADLMVLFLTEAGIIGLLGGLSGLVLGRTVCWVLEAAATIYARRQDIMAPLDVFAFPVWLLAATVAFAVAVSVVAGIYPALRAARVDPIRALRSH
jgi:putative ABC transport system permease protein